MFAIDDSASSFCAREMRGTLSIARTGRLLRRELLQSSGFCAGQMKLTSIVPPSRIRLTSSVLGARTLKTMSALRHSAARSVDDLRAGRAIGLVADLRAVAGTRLDRDPEALLDELLDDFGHGGDTLLARKDFFRNSDLCGMVPSPYSFNVCLRPLLRRSHQRRRSSIPQLCIMHNTLSQRNCTQVVGL